MVSGDKPMPPGEKFSSNKRKTIVPSSEVNGCDSRDILKLRWAGLSGKGISNGFSRDFASHEILWLDSFSEVAMTDGILCIDP